MTKARDLANASTALSAVSATELGYLDGVTSAVQTQLNAKQPTVSGVDDTEIGYLNGVTSSIQTQLDAKLATATAASTYEPVLPSQTGNSGKYLTTNGTAKSWATVVAGPEVVAGKNALINGACDIWQRGTSFASGAGLSASVAYSADRWHWYRGNNTSGATLSRQSSGLTGFQYCIRMQRNSGNTSTEGLGLRYSVESADSYRFAGKTVTLSFWARAGANYSASSNNFRATIATGTGNDQVVHSFTGFTYVVDTNVTLTTTWTRYSITGTCASNITQIGLEMFFNPTGTAGANDYMEITGLQLEEGLTASSFSRAAGTIAGELEACQRYCVKFTPATNNGYERIGVSLGTNSSGQSIFINLPVEMRTYPTSMTTSGTFAVWNANMTTVGSLALSTTPGTHKSAVFLSSNGNSNGFNYFHFYAANTSTDYMLFGAEL